MSGATIAAIEVVRSWRQVFKNKKLPFQNLTPNVPASANVIVAGMSEKAGKKISIMKFMDCGMPIMIVTVLMSTGCVWLRYYVLKIWRH